MSTGNNVQGAQLPPVRAVRYTLGFSGGQSFGFADVAPFVTEWASSFPVIREHAPAASMSHADYENTEASWPLPLFEMTNKGGDRILLLQSDRVATSWIFESFSDDPQSGKSPAYPGFAALRDELMQAYMSLRAYLSDGDIELPVSSVEVLYENEMENLSPVDRIVGMLGGWAKRSNLDCVENLDIDPVLSLHYHDLGDANCPIWVRVGSGEGGGGATLRLTVRVLDRDSAGSQGERAVLSMLERAHHVAEQEFFRWTTIGERGSRDRVEG